MPVILPAERLDEWLTAKLGKAARLIRRAPEEVLMATTVSRHVNDVKNDDPACGMPAEHDAEPAQRSLF
jgi:putative SOS response-associated peptidase YedK